MFQFAFCGLAGADQLDPISFTAWGNITATYPTTTAGTADRPMSWVSPGTRNISADYTGLGTLVYRINSGSWTNYTAPFALTSGQTLAWRITFVQAEVSALTITDATKGAVLQSGIVCTANGAWP